MAELQVGIRADTSGATRVIKSLKEIKRSAKDAGVSLSSASKVARQTSVSYQVASGSALKLAGATDLTSAASASLAGGLSTAAAASGKLSTSENTATAATGRLTLAMERLRASMAGMFVGPTAGMKRFATQARTALGSVVGASTAAAGLGATVAIGLGAGVVTSVKFEKTLSRITGLVGIAKEEVKGFEKPLLDIAKATAKGPNELAEALFFITSAGARGQDALDILAVSAKAAAAGLGETKTVADAVTSAVNAYGKANLSAEQATDILVATVREGKAEADSIAGALGQILPAASELGVEFVELGGVIAALTRIGLGADQGATALGATLAAIQKPGQQARDELEKFGLTASQLRRTVAEEGILPALQMLQEKFGDNEEALTRVFPNIRALRAILPLVGKNAGDVGSIFAAVADNTNATNKAFEAYAETTSFTLNEALVALQVSLKQIGEVLLPAVAYAFVKVTQAVEGTVNVFQGLGAAIAEAISGPDDPLVRAENRFRELNDAVAAFEKKAVKTFKGFDEAGKKIYDIEYVDFNALDKWAIGLAGINKAGVELSGTWEEQKEQLRKARDEAKVILDQTTLEVAQRQNAAKAAADLEKALQPVVVLGRKIGEIEEPRVIDEELLKKGQQSFKDINTEVNVLRADLENLQTLGRDGIGLAEDTEIARQVFQNLQGTIQDLSEKDIVELLRAKRDLQTRVNEITAAFQLQERATQFIEELTMEVGLLGEQYRLISAGGSLIQVQAAQQAAQIMADLGDQADYTAEGIEALIIEQQAWNAAIAAMDTSGLNDIGVFIASLEAKLATLDKGSAAFERTAMAIQGLKDSAIDTAMQELGIGNLVDFTPIAEQLEQGEAKLREAFNLAGIVDPDSDPRFQAALDRLYEKVTGVGDLMKEFGKAAAQNLQSSFSDFLFDPFSDGLDGMARQFGETLRRLAADILSNQILTSFFKNLAGAGGGIGSFGQSALQALGGSFADGGNFSGSKPILVGERGPEIITPRQSGSVIPNEMLTATAPAPQVNVAPAPVIVLDDPAKFSRALATNQNTQRALVDAIATKKGAINAALR